jgi:hypothetical protein
MSRELAKHSATTGHRLCLLATSWQGIVATPFEQSPVYVGSGCDKPWNGCADSRLTTRPQSHQFSGWWRPQGRVTSRSSSWRSTLSQPKARYSPAVADERMPEFVALREVPDSWLEVGPPRCTRAEAGKTLAAMAVRPSWVALPSPGQGVIITTVAWVSGTATSLPEVVSTYQ